jgi:serine/threonine protein phosphatase PrpC
MSENKRGWLRRISSSSADQQPPASHFPEQSGTAAPSLEQPVPVAPEAASAAEYDTMAEETADVAPPAVSAEETPIPRGLPEHIGKRPPRYPPYPTNKPSVGEDDFAAFTPDVVIDGVTLPGLSVRAASVRGDSHRWDGTCRQDALAVGRIGAPGHELLALAVADGVGSSKRSHVASYQASRQVIVDLHSVAERLHTALAEGDKEQLNGLANNIVGRSVEKLRASWRTSAGESYRDKDYATTLHVLLIPVDPAIRDRVLISVGDGGLVGLRDGRWIGLDAETEAMVDTRTAALPAAYDRVVTSLCRTLPGDVLVLGTDGIINPINQESDFRDRLADYWCTGEVPSLSDFLWQAQLRAKTYDDDRSVICVWEEATDR